MPNQFLPHFARKNIGSDVGLQVRIARQRQGLTQAQLAGTANIAPHTLARIERGHQRPRVGTVRAIADALKVNLESLASGWTEDERRRRDNPDHLGRGLRKARQNAGVSLRDAAAAAGVHPTTLSRFERMQTDSLLLSINGVSFHAPKLAALLGFKSVDALSEACSDFYGNGS